MYPCGYYDKQAAHLLFFFPLQAPTLTMEGGRLKRPMNLKAGQDFETVPEPVWRALYHWYGANLSLPRPVCVPAFIIKSVQICSCWMYIFTAF